MLRLGDRATVVGRVVQDGKGVAGTSVGLVSVDRGMDSFTGDYEIGTKDDGQFAFLTIPPGREYFIYTMMKDAKKNGGVARIRRFIAGKDGQLTSVGDLVVQPSFRVAGRLILKGDMPLPAGARIMLGREHAWDYLPNVDVSPDGRFAFEGVPNESIAVSPKLKGYRLSLSNPSLDRLNGFSIVGKADRDLDDLLILLEPGEFHPDFNNRVPDAQPYNRPLRSYRSEPSQTRE